MVEDDPTLIYTNRKPLHFVNAKNSKSMGKRESGNQRFSDLRDDYRKNIGKQDYLKSKKELKKTKMAAELKQSSTHYQDMILVIGTVAGLVLGIYAMFYSISKV